jgi:hypothetical protein
MTDLRSKIRFIANRVSDLSGEKRSEFEDLYNIGSPLAQLVEADVLQEDSVLVAANSGYINSAYLWLVGELEVEYTVTIQESGSRLGGAIYIVTASSPVEAFRKLSSRTLEDVS